MGIFEEDYKKNEHKLKMLYGTFFFADLIWLNYSFSNHNYHNTNGEKY